MKTRLLLATLLLTAGAAGAVAYVRHGSKPSPAAKPVDTEHSAAHDEHAHGIAPLNARAEADGATPCEAAYNGFKAEETLAKETGEQAHYFNIAPRDVFLAKCAKLSVVAQSCLSIRYWGAHRDECELEKGRMPRGALHGMFEMIRRQEDAEQTAWRDRMFAPPDSEAMNTPEGAPVSPP